MKEQIKLLKSELDSTQDELENTILENNDLKKQISILEKEKNTYKMLCKASPHRNGSVKKKRHSLHTDVLSTLTPSRNITSSANDPPENNALVLGLIQKIKGLQQDLIGAKNEITILNAQINELKVILAPENSSSTINKGRKNDIIPTNETTNNVKLKKENPRKIRIYGTQQCVGLASTLLGTRYYSDYQQYEIHGETRPHATSTEIFKNCQLSMNIDDKLIL